MGLAGDLLNVRVAARCGTRDGYCVDAKLTAQNASPKINPLTTLAHCEAGRNRCTRARRQMTIVETSPTMGTANNGRSLPTLTS